MNKELVLQRMKERRVKQVELAKFLGCTDSLVSKYLRGWSDLPERYSERLQRFLNSNTALDEFLQGE